MNETRICKACGVKKHIQEFKKNKAWCKMCLIKIRDKAEKRKKDIEGIDGSASRDVLSFQLGIPLTDPDNPDVDAWELAKKIAEAIQGVVESETNWKFAGSKVDQDVEYRKPFLLEQIDYNPKKEV